MLRLISCLAALAVLVVVVGAGHVSAGTNDGTPMSSPPPGTTVIDFDDRLGGPTTSDVGDTIDPQFLIDDEYSHLGAVFFSAGGGVHLAAPSNPVSPPNAVSATDVGPVTGIGNPVFVTFVVGGGDAVVDWVSIDLTNSSWNGTTLFALDVNNDVLGTDTGGQSATLQYTGDADIHSIRIEGMFAFDNLTFSGLAPIPEPSTLILLTMGAVGLLAYGWRRRRAV